MFKKTLKVLKSMFKRMLYRHGSVHELLSASAIFVVCHDSSVLLVRWFSLSIIVRWLSDDDDWTINSCGAVKVNYAVKRWDVLFVVVFNEAWATESKGSCRFRPTASSPPHRLATKYLKFIFLLPRKKDNIVCTMKQNHTKHVYFSFFISIEGDWRTQNRKLRMSSWGRKGWGRTNHGAKPVSFSGTYFTRLVRM